MNLSPKTEIPMGEHFKCDSKVHTISTEISSSVVSTSGNLIPPNDSLHAALKPIIIMAQCFSVLPVNGVTASDSSRLKFTWKSFKVLYCFVSIFTSALLISFNFYRIIRIGISSVETTGLVFFTTSCISSMLFLMLGVKWAKVIGTWERIERDITIRQRKPSKINLAMKFKIVAAVVMFLALVEHVLSLFSGYMNAIDCATFRGTDDIISTYYNHAFPQVFAVTKFSVVKGILVQLINLLSTFLWNFMDLFLILISIALIDLFRQFNRKLYSIRDKHCLAIKEMPEWWWAEARMDYNRLASLTRIMDDHLSMIVFLSFSTNLYFICMQLLNSFNRPVREVVQKIYLFFSFGFLLLRTIAVSLYASSIHDQSLLPAPILYSISRSSYSTEVSRFLTQVTTDNISLTGMKFFSITRNLVLTVAGTIVTYELVLMQFNSVQQVEPSKNMSHFCGDF